MEHQSLANFSTGWLSLFLFMLFSVLYRARSDVHSLSHFYCINQNVVVLILDPQILLLTRNTFSVLFSCNIWITNGSVWVSCGTIGRAGGLKKARRWTPTLHGGISVCARVNERRIKECRSEDMCNEKADNLTSESNQATFAHHHLSLPSHPVTVTVSAT